MHPAKKVLEWRVNLHPLQRSTSWSNTLQPVFAKGTSITYVWGFFLKVVKECGDI